MKLITCSNYDIKAYKLFDTIRRTNNNFHIDWLIADTKGTLNEEQCNKVQDYFGNMTIESRLVDKLFWEPTQCWYRARWDWFYQISDNYTDDETIVLCDTFDVLFQDKLNDIAIADDTIILCDEGIKHGDSKWCMRFWEGEYQEMYAKEPVYNAGVLIMNGKTYKKLTRLMITVDAEGIGVDQNLLQHICYTNDIKLIDDNSIAIMQYQKEYECTNNRVIIKGHIPIILHMCGMYGKRWMVELYEQLYPVARCEIHEYKIDTEQQYKPYLVGCYFSTKNRKERLWTALLSILTQSLLPDYICIYNDGDTYDITKDHDMYMMLCMAIRKGVTIDHKEGDKKHQTYNHNRATYEMPTDYIIRLDDDGYAENNLVASLVDALKDNGNNIYSCATKWAHKLIPYDPNNKNIFDAETLEKEFLSTTEFDKEFTEPIEVGFLHGHCFAYKKDDKLHQPDWSLEMTVCEDTAFCLHASKMGKKLFVIPTTTYWHLPPIQTASQDFTKPNQYKINIRSKND